MSSLFLLLPLPLALLVSTGCRTAARRGPQSLLDGCFVLPPTEEDAHAYRSVARSILDSGQFLDDRGGVEKLASHGLWKAEGSAYAGLPISVGSLPPVAMTGVDRPHEGQQVLPTAWQALCTPSPPTFLHNKSCRGGYYS